MASISAETSFWIKFFTEAGIPAGDSAHYAIIFSDNRIGREMMLDLSKEYLTDMGVTRLGDIIAILKHAKKVHNQEARDMLLKSSPTARSVSPLTSTPRRSTAASRMVNQITSKHPEAGPMSQQPSPRPVSPDPPSIKRKVSVFERLGAEGGDMTVSVPKMSPESGSNGVFSRLGGKSALKRSAETELRPEGPELPYVGVLKNKKKKVEEVSTPMALRIKKTIKTNVCTDLAKSSIQRPEVSTTEGVLSAHAKKDTPSLRERLGAKTEMPSSTTMLNMDRVSSSKLDAPVQKRLNFKKVEEQSSSPVVSSTQQISAKHKTVTVKSLNTTKDKKGKTSGVFSRLGKMSKV